MKVPTALCEDNLEMIISSTNSNSELKKMHVAISYDRLRDSVAAGMVNPIKVYTTVNQSNILTEYTLVGTLGTLSDASCGVA